MRDAWQQLLKRLAFIVYRDRKYLSKQDAIDAVVIAVVAGAIGVGVAQWILTR